MTVSGRPWVVALMGPTASGKTALGVALAQALDGEIISVDSSLVYRGMDIGTAKPTEAERGGIPHHLIDILDPREPFSTGQFRSRALDLIDEITARGRVPLLVGGTMLYFNALLRGLSELPPADREVRRQIDLEAEIHGWAEMHRRLSLADPAAARRIHPNDPQRIQRALEVHRLTGTPLTDLFQQTPQCVAPFHATRLVLSPADRGVLHERIARRFHEMLRQGLVEEVERLYRRGDLDASLPAIRAVGYRQVWAYLTGDYDRDTMVERAIVATRQFAKRQLTWLRREQDAAWLDSAADRLLDRALACVRACRPGE